MEKFRYAIKTQFFFTFEDFFVKKMEVKKMEKVFFLKKLKEVVPIKLNQ